MHVHTNPGSARLGNVQLIGALLVAAVMLAGRIARTSEAPRWIAPPSAHVVRLLLDESVLSCEQARVERARLDLDAAAVDERPRRQTGTSRLIIGVAILTTLSLAALASTAAANVRWSIGSVADTTVAQNGSLTFHVQVTNSGDSAADASAVPMTFGGELPSGMTVSSVTSVLPSGLFGDPTAWDCSTVVAGSSSFSCTDSSIVLEPLQFTTLSVDVAVDGTASGVLTTRFTVSGGDPATGDPSNPSTTTPDPTTVAASPPPFGVDAFDGSVNADAAGTPFTQAGGHPYSVTTSIDFNTYTNPAPYKGDAWPVEPEKDVFVDLPPGFVGNPTNVAQCTLEQLAHAESIASKPTCPATSQIGVTFIRTLNSTFFPFFGGFTIPGVATTAGPIPVYNMVPPPNVPARFAFNAAGAVVTLDAHLRSGSDYGVSVDVKDISEGLAVSGTTLTLWGVPADPSHDFERACPGAGPPSAGLSGCESGDPLTAFLRNPTSCTAPGVGLPTTLRTDSWTHPGDFREATFFSHLPPGFPATPDAWGPQVGTTGCDRVPFRPAIDARPRQLVAGAPSEFDVDVSLPQSDDPDPSIGESDLKKAVVTLPQGVRVNPSSASGLQGCSPGQIALHSDSDPTCPDGSKIGSVTINTPLLRDPLQGAVYLASPNDNPFGTLLAIYIVAKGPGVIVKLAGKVQADPVTGQLTTTVDDNPQTPFSNVHLEFKGGSRAALINPPACGTYTTHAVLTGWNGRTVSRDSSFTLSHDGHGAPCPAAQFTPGFAAGTESSRAGSSSPFHARFTRDDDDEELSSVSVNLPRGLIGRIAAVTLCGEFDAAHGLCHDASKIGSVTVGAGAGPNPFYISNGRAYLTGPYKGAPFGLSIVVPAVAGPFDLGTVNVRSALFVDKHDATVRIVSDPLPTILQGIPLDVRDVRVDADRSGFMINPTSCAEKHIDATIGSTGGKRADLSDRFQAAECRSLGFAPRMVLTVGGRGHTARNRTTPLSTRLTMPRGDANLRYVRVILPQSINARLTVINDACTRAQFENDISRCDHAQAGTAAAVTPLLRDPLRAKVYFVKNGHPIPDLFVALRGQVDFDLIGRITIPGGTRLATTFDAAPDVPVTSFVLRLFGDPRNGSVGAATNLCSARARRSKASLDYIGQNGRSVHIGQRLVIRGCRHRSHRHHRRHRRH
jgi:hypothetical protein